MARQLKRWESPRKEGRNDKGRGGSARQRQRKKQFQALRKKLKEQSDQQDNTQQKREANQLPFFVNHLENFKEKTCCFIS
jgi:hypothetical protein